MDDIRKGRCPLCKETQVLEAQATDITDSVNGINHQMSVTYQPGWLFTSRAKVQKPYGLLSIYVCVGCGYTQWFTKDPKSIPVGPEFGTRLIDGSVPDQGPFR